MNAADKLEAHIQEVDRQLISMKMSIETLVNVAERDSLEAQYLELFKLVKAMLQSGEE